MSHFVFWSYVKLEKLAEHKTKVTSSYMFYYNYIFNRNALHDLPWQHTNIIETSILCVRLHLEDVFITCIMSIRCFIILDVLKMFVK